MKSRAWLLYLGGGIAALLGFLSLPHLRQGWFFNLISLSSPVAIVVAVRMWKPNARAPWYLFALGQTFFVIGDVITYNYNDFFGSDLPYPSIGDVAYLSASWHPDTRPEDLELDDETRWVRLDILGTEGGGPFDRHGTVEFRASYRTDEERGVLHERSRFTREGGRWFSVDGEL